MPTYYDTLDVAADAPHDEVRKAYHRAARLWHPDRFVGRPQPEAENAADAMRQVNEAWRILGDPSRRRSYDRELRGPSADPGGRASSIRTDDGITRIDPRLLDPEYLYQRRIAQEDERLNEHSSAVRVLPILAFFGLLIGIFIFTAYASARQSEPPPKLDLGFEIDDCVRILPGPQLLSTPCNAQSDGVVIAAYNVFGAKCPVTTVREIELANGVTVCLGTVSDS